MPDLHQKLNAHIVQDILACPLCGASMAVSEDGRSLICTGKQPCLTHPACQTRPARKHCFDGAASGYLPLAPRHSGGGDAKEAVRARADFLRHGYYASAAERLCRIALTYAPEGGSILDAGCGEGYFSNQLANAGFDVLGVDLSKFAVDAAAKAAAPCQRKPVYAVASVFELPVREESLDGVTNIFAPCAPQEYARVLRPGGYLIVAGAGETHLMELKRLIYTHPYLNDTRHDLPGEDAPFTCVDKQNITFTTKICGQEHVRALFAMTPYYWRTSREGQAKTASLESLETEVSFDFYVYQKKVSTADL